jgi:ferredoxin
MTTYQVTVDRKLCSGFATCVELAPHLFRLESDGLASAVVAETDDPAAVDAMAQCPMAAINVVEAAAAEREAA